MWWIKKNGLGATHEILPNVLPYPLLKPCGFPAWCFSSRLVSRYLQGNGVQLDLETAAYYLACACDKAHAEYHLVGKQPVLEMQRLTAANGAVVEVGQKGEDDDALQYQVNRPGPCTKNRGHKRDAFRGRSIIFCKPREIITMKTKKNLFLSSGGLDTGFYSSYTCAIYRFTYWRVSLLIPSTTIDQRNHQETDMKAPPNLSQGSAATDSQ